MIEYLLLGLIPLAGGGGWWLARNLSRRSEQKRNRMFSSRYFQGLNYLLDEQPDKAIQVFLEMAEVNKDTVETHLALGNLFRRRGEVAAPELRCAEHSTAELRGCRARFEARYINPL